jgi:Protein of unknown function (DUF664)
MNWTAPEVTRPGGSLVAPEREMLQGYLDFHRTTLLVKCAGLTGAQLAERAAPPSNVSLLGLIRHLAKVERIWFRLRFAGQDVQPLYAGTDVDYDVLDPDRAQQEYQQLLDEWRLADAAVADASLDDTFTVHDDVASLRMIYLHLIGEYARHNGHADMVREHLDGLTGA